MGFNSGLKGLTSKCVIGDGTYTYTKKQQKQFRISCASVTLMMQS